MREVKIIQKEKVQEFKSLENLIDNENFVGMTLDKKRFFISQDEAHVWGFGISVLHGIIEYQDIEERHSSVGVFKFFVFDSAKELYTWLAEE